MHYVENYVEKIADYYVEDYVIKKAHIIYKYNMSSAKHLSL